MPSRTRKLRGSRTHGRGKKHGRGAGGRGGTGMAGLHKHKFKWMVKYDPDHFGRHGFVRHALRRPIRAINLEELAVRLPAFEASGHARKTDGGYEIDLAGAGFEKLLGGGRLTLPLTIHVGAASEKAVAKVQEAGGKVLLISGPKE